MVKDNEVVRVLPTCLISSKSSDSTGNGLLIGSNLILTLSIFNSNSTNHKNEELDVILEEIKSGNESQKSIRKVVATFLSILDSSKINEIIRMIFSDSNWKYASSTKNDELRFSNSLPEINFILLRIKSIKIIYKPESNIPPKNSDLKIGERIYVIGTPFANLNPKMFFNSASGGIISNLVGDHEEVFLIDARCMPGYEGGTVYKCHKFNKDCELIGAVLVPMLWKSREYVGLSVCCKIQYIQRILNKEHMESHCLNNHDNNNNDNNNNNNNNNIDTDNIDKTKSYKTPTHPTNPPMKRNHIPPFASPTPVPVPSSTKTFNSVVYVECGRSWGSGILIDVDEGLVVTCGHVVMNDGGCGGGGCGGGGCGDGGRDCGGGGCGRSGDVSDGEGGEGGGGGGNDNGNSGSKVNSSSVIGSCRGFKTAKVHIPHLRKTYPSLILFTNSRPTYDVAILKLDETSRRDLRGCGLESLNTGDVCFDFKVGMEVYACGHMAFDKCNHMKPSMTRGIISKVSYHNRTPVLIQSSSCVNSGMSGGPLLDDIGRIVGVVVCNARDQTNGICFPHINLHIPFPIIWSRIEEYLETKCINVFKSLSLDDGELLNIWSLTPSGPTKLKCSL